MGNKTNELSCLNLAIEQCLNQKGISKKIGQLLAGEDIDRDSDEAPDFLRYCKPFGNEEKGTVIGIEHFRVDHFSEELKNHKVSSLGYQYERNLKNAVDTWQPKISEDSDIPEGALSTMGELIAQLLAIRIQATYNAFIESFRYSLRKHLRSVERYRSVIKQYANGNSQKLVLLIEIHSDFSKIFFHDKKGIHYQDDTTPLFDEIVKEIEKIDSKQVDYVVLCFGGTVYNEKTKVIAVFLNNFRNQLKKRNIPIYHYAGHDLSLEKFQTPRLDMSAKSEYERNGDNIDFTVTISSRDITYDKQLEMVVVAYQNIKKLEKRGLNYATTDLVEMFYQLYDDYFSKIQPLNTESIIKLIPIITMANKTAFDQKFEQFKEKWDIGKKDDET